MILPSFLEKRYLTSRVFSALLHGEPKFSVAAPSNPLFLLLVQLLGELVARFYQLSCWWLVELHYQNQTARHRGFLCMRQLLENHKLFRSRDMEVSYASVIFVTCLRLRMWGRRRLLKVKISLTENLLFEWFWQENLKSSLTRVYIEKIFKSFS